MVGRRDWLATQGCLEVDIDMDFEEEAGDWFGEQPETCKEGLEQD